MANFRIREAKREDCAEILRLIKELASFEKMEDSVQMTVDVLQRDGFGEKPLYRSLVVEELVKDGEAIPDKLLAYSLFYDIYSTWEGRCIYLEDLCVTPDHRNKGIGSALFKRITQVNGNKLFLRIVFSLRSLFETDTSTGETWQKKACQWDLNLQTQICVDEGYKRLQWTVLAWNSEAINFYKKFGGVNMTDKEEWHVYRIEREAMNKIIQ